MTNDNPNTSPGAASSTKQVKISLAMLPAGTKEGDSLSLKVTSVDQATGTAYCMADVAPAIGEHEMEGGEPTGEPPANEESDDAPMDTKTLLGPMDGLKNYLVQKSMDVPKNQGR